MELEHVEKETQNQPGRKRSYLKGETNAGMVLN